MSELAPLIADLALILICAGVMTLIFKKLGQPLVLGYIVAGFIASPHFALTPSVVDAESIQVWSEIGVIFLLFALGLEFSFKKIVKAGGPAIITTLTIIFGMIVLGFLVGSAFGWSKMDALFLGGMICMSSTTIIYKAFEDLGLAKKKFAGLVMSVLILEDILAVVLMVVLSTVAVSSNFEGGELVRSIFKLVFFLVLWLVVGIYLIPLILRKTRPLMNDETLLVAALGLCFMMVVVAAKTGFSAAFGAFIMGSILSETLEAEHIEKLVKPVKDLFGAIFFVSVGMMVNPAMIAQYWLPILIITLTVIVGQPLFAIIGVLLSGQPLKTAVQSGFSLSQIGEFSFIIATLGVSLGVTSDFLYPIVVAVSVVTIFLTPYMIRLAEPAYGFIYRVLPQRAKDFLDEYSHGADPAAAKDSAWKIYLGEIARMVLINGIVAVAICIIGINVLHPLVTRVLPETWANIVTAVILLVALSPFLRAIAVKKSRGSEVFDSLWAGDRANHAPLIAITILRYVLAVGFTVFILAKLFHVPAIILLLLAPVLGFFLVFNKWTKRSYKRLEQTFQENLRSRDVQAEILGQKKPEYASRLLDKDLHLADFDVPAEVEWAGAELRELDFGQRYGVHVVSILRGQRRINIPKATTRIFPQDRIQVIGTDNDLEVFGAALHKHEQDTPETWSNSEMILRRLAIGPNSPFAGKALKDSGVRNRYHCLVAGVEKPDGTLHIPDAHLPLEEGDFLWLVGEHKDIDVLMSL
ncbi:MAG: cation:proton antiporter [Bacteroidales bacterium]|nr:cation:proton antiporter [Bacteroidales bacterium]